MLVLISGSTLWTRLLQCLYNTVVCPAADLSCWPDRGNARSPPARAPHHAQHAVQTPDDLWQRQLRLHRHAAPGPAAVTPQRLRAQSQTARQLRGGMWVSEEVGECWSGWSDIYCMIHKNVRIICVSFCFSSPVILSPLLQAWDAQRRAAQPQLHQTPAECRSAATNKDIRSGENCGRA